MPELQLGRIKLDLAVQLGVVRNHLPAENPSTHVALVWREYGLHMSSWDLKKKIIMSPFLGVLFTDK